MFVQEEGKVINTVMTDLRATLRSRVLPHVFFHKGHTNMHVNPMVTTLETFGVQMS